MPELAMPGQQYLSQPFSSTKLNKSALLEVGLFHLAIAGLLLSSWTPAIQHEPAVKTINIQMFELPKQHKPIEEKVLEKTPPPVKPEPVIEPKQAVKKAIEKNDLAFKRVEKTIKKPIEKPVPKKTVQKKIEKVTKTVEKKHVKPVSKTVNQEKRLKPSPNKQAVATKTSTNPAQKAQISSNEVETDTFSVEHYKPIEKQAPDYPRGALRKGLEGDCTVRYTVNKQGRVESAEVLAGCHPLFKRPSLAAAKTFRYSPHIVNGKAVAVTNVRNTFEYRIH